MGEVSHGKKTVTIVESIRSTHGSVVRAVDQGIVINQILAASYRIKLTGHRIASTLAIIRISSVVDYPIHDLLGQVFDPVGGKGHLVAGVAARSRAFAQYAIILIPALR